LTVLPNRWFVYLILSIDELEKLRDNCLHEIMLALKKFEVGAGSISLKK